MRRNTGIDDRAIGGEVRQRSIQFEEYAAVNRHAAAGCQRACRR